MHSNIATIISSSFLGAGLSSGWVHGCIIPTLILFKIEIIRIREEKFQLTIIPFISKYKLSNSTLFGFGSDASSGTHFPSCPSIYLDNTKKKTISSFRKYSIYTTIRFQMEFLQ